MERNVGYVVNEDRQTSPLLAFAYSLIARNWADTDRSTSCLSPDTLAYCTTGVSG